MKYNGLCVWIDGRKISKQSDELQIPPSTALGYFPCCESLFFPLYFFSMSGITSHGVSPEIALSVGIVSLKVRDKSSLTCNTTHLK